MAAAGIFTLDYSADQVNSLLHISKSSDLPLDEAALACGDIIVSAGLQQIVAVSRLHNHYALGENERVVATVQDSAMSKKGGTSAGSSILVTAPSPKGEGF